MYDDLPVAAYFSMLFLTIFAIAAIWFMYTQQKTLQLIRLEHRRMRPGQVWLQLIPAFGLVWQFVVIIRLSDSIRQELQAPIGDALFAEQEVPTTRPTFSIGIQYAVLICAGMLPIPGVKNVLAFAGLVCWILYWVQLARYKKILAERALLTGRNVD